MTRNRFRHSLYPIYAPRGKKGSIYLAISYSYALFRVMHVYIF